MVAKVNNKGFFSEAESIIKRIIATVRQRKADRERHTFPPFV
jgi:hypothetical protein